MVPVPTLAFVYFCVWHPLVPQQELPSFHSDQHGHPGPGSVHVLQPRWDNLCSRETDNPHSVYQVLPVALVPCSASAALCRPTACMWPPHVWQCQGIHTWRAAACPSLHHQTCHCFMLGVGRLGWQLAEQNLFSVAGIWFDDDQLAVFVFNCSVIIHLSSCPSFFNLQDCYGLSVIPRAFHFRASGEVSSWKRLQVSGSCARADPG